MIHVRVFLLESVRLHRNRNRALYVRTPIAWFITRTCFGKLCLLQIHPDGLEIFVYAISAVGQSDIEA